MLPPKLRMSISTISKELRIDRKTVQRTAKEVLKASEAIQKLAEAHFRQ